MLEKKSVSLYLKVMKLPFVNRKTLIFLWIPAMISLGLWLNSKTSFSLLKFSPWLFCAQGFGILAITFISLNFIYTTRLRILERIFDGLHHLYYYHKVTGILGITFMLSHFSCLILHGTAYPSLLYTYLLPGSYWSLDFARIAFFTFVILTVFTMLKKVPYHTWKFSHQFMGLAFFFAILHVLTIKSDVSKNFYLRSWVELLILVGFLSFIYTKFLYRYFGPKNTYIISRIEFLKGKVNLISMTPLKKALKYRPGQFLFVSFQSEKISKESHPFTIVSCEEENILKISPKESGDFTRTIKNVELGTKLNLWGPYGSFSDPFLIDEKDQVWIAGGIGITPFMSMLEHQNYHSMNAKKTLFYCNRSPEWSSYDTHLFQETKKHNIPLIMQYTDTVGYLTFDQIKLEVSNVQNKLFLICGPKVMREGVVKMLVKAGIHNTNIIYEDFVL
jgi:predicted ferric reductase